MKNMTKKSFEFPRGCLVLYTRTPVAGRVKTRMHGVLGEAGALALHKALIEYTYRNLAQAALCPVQLWVATEAGEEASNAYFLSLTSRQAIFRQRAGDLGTRMRHTAEAVLANADYVVIVGTDCASVDPAYLRQALAALEAGTDIVIGPAEDGGYVLLGLRSAPVALFENVPWGSERVMAVTRENLRAAGLSWQELPMRWDVDTPDDLARLSALNDAFNSFLNR